MLRSARWRGNQAGATANRVDKTFSATILREPLSNVIPAKAGIHNTLISLDPRLRGSDEAGIDQRFLDNGPQMMEKPL